MRHRSPGGLSQNGMSDALALVPSHIHPGQCRAPGPCLHSGPLAHTLHLDPRPRKQDLTSFCSRGISSHSPMALIHVSHI